MGSNKKHIKNLKAYIASAEQRAKYSIERFDILIISLSSGGIALGVSLFEKFLPYDHSYIFYGICFFSLALVINLSSQVTGFFANRYDIKYCLEEIKELEKKKFKTNYKIFDCLKKVFNFLTKLLNTTSVLSLIIAIVYITVFFKNLK